MIRRIISRISFVLIVLVLIAMAILSQDIVTILFLSIMGFFMLVAYFTGVRKLKAFRIGITKGRKKIEEVYENNDEKIFDSISLIGNLFENKELDSLFNSYKKELNRLRSRDKDCYSCDIADYINIDTLSEISNHNLLSQIPGMMTGLGILGTFVGLTLGLRQFDSTTADTMAASIPVLMEGIKVAFLTSIYGVVLSLSFNLIVGNEMHLLVEELESFCSYYYEKIIPNPENDVINTLMGYQKEQLDTMKQFAETIAIKIAEKFQEVTAPTFGKINDTMEGLSDRMIANQTQGLNDVVESFVKEMNSSLNGEFEELGRTIRNVCEWQKDMMSDVQEALEEISNSATNMANVNKDTEEILSNLNEYTDRLNDYQIGVNESYKTFEEERSMFGNISENQMSCLNQLNDHEEELRKEFENAGDRIKEMCSIIEAQLDQNKELSRQLNDNMEENTKNLLQASDAFNDDVISAINKTFKIFDSNLGDIAMHLSGTISQIDESTQSLPKALQAYFEELKDEYKKYVDNVADTQNEIKETVSRILSDSRVTHEKA